MAEKQNYSVSKEKSSKFLDAIQKYADKQREKINDEVQSFKEAELKKAEDDGLRDAYNLIHKELAVRQIAISSEMAKEEDLGRSKIYARRTEITKEIFDSAKKKLSDFTSSDEYKAQLQKDAKEIANFFGNNDVVLYVSSKDAEFAKQLLNIFGGKGEINIANDIVIGGIRAVCTQTQTMIDKTLDSNLELQKEWFYKNSGLKVL